jgi:AcrR family transcriptional regulator
MVPSSGKAQERGVRSSAKILDAAEQLMAARGYAATTISAICKDTGLPPTSIYHHFGNKQQLLAAVMERGAQRWFASLPAWDGVTTDVEDQVLTAADAVAGNPLFLRLFYMLSLDSETDSAAAELVDTVRASAYHCFEGILTEILLREFSPDTARRISARLAPFAVALSDGCFFSLQLDAGRADIRQTYLDLVTAVRAMAPTIAKSLGA